ncbi:protein TASOR [Elysia marginata]|uniref:Protein TASOR n=1 Tax=Elysia marginata TaxID=1093978 RepID=A0AAV4EP19_9GAST|nr:protein TASOR [Elysia marginata]
METAGKASSYGPKRKTVPRPNGPQFTIPRLKKIKRDLLTELSLESHECQNDILAPLRKSFHFHASNSSHEFLKVQAVHNPDLVAKYLDRRKDMKSNGYSDSLVSDTVAFIPVENALQIEQLCKEGIKCGNQKLSGLGVTHMAVHACKHADIMTPLKPKGGERILIAVKVIKGRVKTVLCRGVGCELEPTPNYDCHIAKSNLDQPAMQSPHLLFYSSQLYLYEYGDFDVEEFPRQILPFAVIYYSVKEPQQVIPKIVNSSTHLAQTNFPNPAVVSGPAGTMAWQGQQLTTCYDTGLGPVNEVWRGRLHVRLIEGGHIYIEVSMLSHYVPLTVNIISPIKIHSLFPEHNAQFTFLNGLSNLAEQAEVEWRAHYFRSYLMRPRPNNEGHFKALLKHISAKREMPTVRLPNDVFLFLMPNCLLASQLGLVRMEDNSPVLHCVLMSKFSTSEAEKKKLAIKKRPLPNLGTATSWEELFDDSDLSDEEAPETASVSPVEEIQARLVQILPLVFKDQQSIQNKFAAMSLADAEANLPQCSCKSVCKSKIYRQKCRDTAVQNIHATLQLVSQPSKKSTSTSHLPDGSRRKPKVKMSHRTRNTPSFSPHGSSESESDSENGPRSSRRATGHLSILHSTKTVEEELSEEELTNEQMEDIIFMRKKPAQTARVSRSSRNKQLAPSSSLKPNLIQQPQQKEPSLIIPKQKPQASPLSPVATLDNQHFDTLFDKREYREPSFSSKPKIIPIDPVEELDSTPPGSPRADKAAPLVISNQFAPESEKTDSTSEVKDKRMPSVASGNVDSKQDVKKISSPPSEKGSSLVKQSPDFENLKSEHSINSPVPKTAKDSELVLSSVASTCDLNGLPASSAIHLKQCSLSQTSQTNMSPVKTLSLESSQNSCTPLPLSPSLQSEAHFFSNDVDYGDVDMRDPNHQSSSLNPVFLKAAENADISSPPLGQTQNQPCQRSPNLSFGMWLAPSEMVVPTEPSVFSGGFWEQAAAGPLSLSPPSSPVSLPANSPPSPTDSPASPPIESPASPTSHDSPLTPAEPDVESPMSPPRSSTFSTRIALDLESPMSPPQSSSFLTVTEPDTESPMSPPRAPTLWSPTEPDMESPMSPPRSSTFSTLRSVPIAIPTSRLEQQTESPEINYLQRQSPFASRSLNAQTTPAASASGIDNADDMKDFLNGDFNPDLDSSYEDER